MGITRQPTTANLQEDAAKIANQISEFWWGDVDVVVILAARQQIQPECAVAVTLRSSERLRTMLRAALAKVPLLGSNRAKGALVLSDPMIKKLDGE